MFLINVSTLEYFCYKLLCKLRWSFTWFLAKHGDFGHDVRDVFICCERAWQVFEILWVRRYLRSFFACSMLIWALSFEASLVWSTVDANILMNKLKCQIGTPSCTSSVSHASLKLRTNPIIGIGLKKSVMWAFVWQVVRFDVCLQFFETMCSYLLDLLSNLYVR